MTTTASPATPTSFGQNTPSRCSAFSAEVCRGTWPGSPGARLAVLPGTSHVGVLDRVDWLSSMILAFLPPQP